MDPEPGRCRRTDGKKWRCYGSVVPDQKYCERHMHRGSQRSRKLVEASKSILKSNNEGLPSDKKFRSSMVYSRTSVSHGISVPVSTTLDLTPPSATAETGFTSISYKSNSECSSSSTNAAQVDSSTAIISPLLNAQAVKNNNTRNVSNWNDFLGNSNSGKSSSVAAGFGVSPKSVLQGDIGTSTGYRNLSFDNNKVGTQNEALRCRRTDGKRWRCSRVVVPCKKYCENHLHRGSKKAATMAAAVAGASYLRKPEMAKNYRVLDTNLSISIAANPQQVFDNDASSSSSDATTVSDENVSHFHTFS